MQEVYDNKMWINENFNDLDLGDKRRSNRACKIALKFLEAPHESIPRQMKNWSEVKAAYRFFNNSNVTYTKIQASHKERVIKDISKEKLVLFPQDTSDLEFACEEEMGPLGYHKGMLFHSCLAITIQDRISQVIGLANQKAWVRSNGSSKKKETKSIRYKRERESAVWLDTLKSIGIPPKESKWVSIGDRGNDIFEFMNEAKELGWEFIVRASQNRAIEEEEYSLTKIRSLLPSGKTRVEMRKKGESVNREIELNLCFLKAIIQPPVRLRNKDACEIWMIRCWNEEEKIEWILYSSLPVETEADAIEKCFWYSCRWIIEEYHKCLKTGCKIEERQLKKEKGLKALLGMLSVIAVKLLQLKGISRVAKDVLAKEEVPEVLVKIICKKYELNESRITLREFWRRIAMYGGFLARKSDGDPGWQTIWKGWLDLLAIWEGFEMALDIMKANQIVEKQV